MDFPVPLLRQAERPAGMGTGGASVGSWWDYGPRRFIKNWSNPRNLFVPIAGARRSRMTPCMFMEYLIMLEICFFLQGDMELIRIFGIVDPNRTGRVQFDAFLDFMTREITDTDSAAQIIESFRVLSGAKVMGV